MHHKTTLSRHRFTLDAESRITREDTVLSQKIFSDTPSVRY